MKSKPHRSVSADLYEQPGHLLRRAHQIAMGMFMEEVGEIVTPKEFALLRMIHEKPGVDQVGLARLVGIDTSSAALTAARLEKRGLITRAVSEQDRRLLKLRLRKFVHVNNEESRAPVWHPDGAPGVAPQD